MTDTSAQADWWLAAGRIETLKQLWADGASARQIAAEIGAVSRNAVLGKIHRLKLAARPQPEAKPRERSTIKKVANPLGQRHKRSYFADHEISHENPHEIIPHGPGIPFLEVLQSKGCKFAVNGNGPPHLFCGEVRFTGRPYCPYHCRIAYLAPKERAGERDRARVLA